MADSIISQFERQFAFPIETARQVQGVSDRDAINSLRRWEGMLVYVKDDSKTYILKGGITNSEWEDFDPTIGVTAWGAITGTLSDQIDLQASLNLKENNLGNPGVSGYILSSTTGGVRSWIPAPSGGGTWGSITGTLSAQTDLQSALDALIPIATNSSITGIKAFTKTIRARAANTTNATYNQRAILMDMSGDIAFLVWQSNVWNGTAFVSGSGLGVGPFALDNNKGKSVMGVGNGALKANTADFVTGVGQSAFENNTGANGVAIGFLAGQSNIGVNLVAIGAYAGSLNEGIDGVLVGFRAGGQNKGATVVLTGVNSGRYNRGARLIGIGPIAGLYNLGDDSIGVGNGALQYAKGIKNVILGHNSFNTFYSNVATLKTFSTGDVNTGADTITITAHGFGANGTFVNLLYHTSGGAISPLLVDGTATTFEIIDANTVKSSLVDLISTGSGTQSLTAQYQYEKVNILGADLQPTRNDQTILGGLSAVLPNSTIAEATSVGAKSVVTQEYLAEQRIFADIEVDAAVTGTKNIAVNSYGSFRYSLTGTTTLTESGTPASGKSCVRTLIITGNQTLNLPSSWAANKVGAYVGTKRNLFTVSYMNIGGTLEVDVVINQMN